MVSAALWGLGPAASSSLKIGPGIYTSVFVQ